MDIEERFDLAGRENVTDDYDGNVVGSSLRSHAKAVTTMIRG